jgi:hypothetical protein
MTFGQENYDGINLESFNPMGQNDAKSFDANFSYPFVYND